MTTQAPELPGSRHRPRHALARTLLPAALAVALSIASGVWAAPWLLPLRIVEGPYLQNTTETATTVLWWTMRPSQCELVVTIDGAERTLRAPESAWCNRIRVEGLTAGRKYPYQIRIGSRILAEGTLHTNHRGERPTRFIVFGDSGKGTPQQYALAQKMVEQDPDFLLHTGDLIYGSGEREKYAARFFAPYRALLADRTFWPCLGNHDIASDAKAEPYRAVFELPANGPPGLPPDDNYWFDFANVRIAVLDSNLPEAELREKISPWLNDVFSAAGDRWRIVVFHHPPYSLGNHGCDLRVQSALVPQIEALRIDLVLSGHDHLYTRTVPLIGGRAAVPGERGVIYVVSGAGGAGLYKARTTEKAAKEAEPGDDLALYAATNDKVHSFSLIEIEGDSLSLRQISIAGDVLDQWSLARAATQPAQSSP